MPPKKRSKAGLKVDVEHGSSTVSWKVQVWYHLRPPFAIFFEKVLDSFSPKMLGVGLGVAPLYFLWLYMGKPEYRESDVFNTQSDFVYRFLVAISSFGNPYPPMDLTPEEFTARGLAFWLGFYNYIKSGMMGKQYNKIIERAEQLAPVVFDYLAGRIGKSELEKFLGELAEPVTLGPASVLPTEQAQALQGPRSDGDGNSDDVIHDPILDLIGIKPSILILSWHDYEFSKSGSNG